MGQSVSRRRESPPIPGSTSDLPPVTDSAGPSSESHQNSPSNRARHTSEGLGSRRSSVRRSLVNLVKPSNIRSRVNSIASTPGDLRRSWRNSRRLSRAPVEPIPTIDNSTLPSSSTSAIGGPSNVDKGKRPERRAFVDEEDEDEYHEAVEEQPIHPSTSLPAAEVVPPVASSSAPISQHIGEHSEDMPDLISTPLPDPVLDTSEAIPGQATMEPPPTPRPQTVPLPPRQFPPPGTLVIVQGVVHTTDISRTPPSHESSPASTPQETQDDAGRSRTRDRLSALLRPSSTSRPSSAVLNEPPTVTVTPPEATFDESLSLSATSQTAVTTPSGVTQPLDTSTEPQPSPQLPETAPERHPSISSSSIDVLGTLLSVAAAATAASLLTGSSEPILSSGLAPPQRHPSPPPPSPISIPPVPAYPPPPLPPRIAPDISATSRADRMRHAWGTIRERLGLRPSVPSGTATPVDENGVPPAGAGGLESVPTDARELMLAEMARAFNIGLGLNGLGGLTSNPGNESGPAGGPADTGAVEASSGTGNNNSQASERNNTPPPAVSETALSITMPPEGSFERFLVDLQLDLRLALTRPEGETTPSTDQVAPDAQAESQAERPSQSPTPLTSTSQSHSTSPPISGPSIRPRLSEMVGQAPPISTASPTDGVQEGRISNAPEVTSAESDTDSIPQLMSVSDSESEDTEDEDDDYDEEDFHSANRESLHGGDHHRNGAVHSGMGRIDASGRINWWRLYRFPQITSITLDMAAAAGLRQAGSRGASNTDLVHREPSLPTTTQSPNHPSTSTSSTPPSPMPEGSTTAHRNIGVSENSVGPQTPPQPFATSRSVVPVIIVGLQSVNPEWRDMATPNENDDTNAGRQTGNNNSEDADLPSPSARGAGDEESTLEGDTGALGAGGSTGEPTGGRGRSRGWPSRAANAIRNLRPGRRTTDAGPAASQPSGPSNGSRTFLIYVIGGYYPPEHTIVTGGPNNFDSFEALLELADLLGQVKTSTVSKEEIEKSGLEVIKASLLPQYFREDKITANCLERCLVCLEEYQPEEDVRVMRCRHVFHKGCVDEWMQKGRNNCPACRSTGVSTDVPAQTA